MDPALEIRMVWENLALAMAMWTGTRKGLITTDHLRAGKTVVPIDECKLAEVHNRLELTSNQDLARCVNNQVRGAVTFSAMQTHKSKGRRKEESPGPQSGHRQEKGRGEKEGCGEKAACEQETHVNSALNASLLDFSRIR